MKKKIKIFIHKFLPDYKVSFHYLGKQNGIPILGGTDLKNKEIIIDEKYLNILNSFELKQLLLHEIAHGLTPWVNEDYGHGYEWEQMFIEIGGNPSFVYLFKYVKGGRMWKRHFGGGINAN